MNMKQCFLIFCLSVFLPLSAGFPTKEEFFDSLKVHPLLADLEWDLIFDQTKESFYHSLLSRAFRVETTFDAVDRLRPRDFFKQLQQLYNSTLHLYPEVQKEFLCSWFAMNNNLQINLNLVIQLLSLNPKYASIFLTKSLNSLVDFEEVVNHPLVVLFCLLAGENPNICGENGQNALSLMISQYQEGASEKSVELLLLAGAQPNIKTGALEETALHRAAYTKNRCIIHSLLENRANPYLKNKKEQTPRDIIVMSKRFPHTNLISSPLRVRRCFEKNRTDTIDTFRVYCGEIEDDFKVGETVFSIVKKLER